MLVLDATILAVDETVILMQPPLALVGVSMVMERERQKNDSLVTGHCSLCQTHVAYMACAPSGLAR